MPRYPVELMVATMLGKGDQMEVEAEILDQGGEFGEDTISCSRLAFLKHMAMAGQGFMPSVSKYTRTIGMFFHYIEYLSSAALEASRFSEPPPERQDPTEKGQFSNVVGKALGDLLARRLSGARATLNYEGAMAANGHKIRGRRPDLYCLGEGYQFAVEAKGYETGAISPDTLIEHKDQSRQGPLAVNFTVASVAYNLYRKIKVKYHDPYNEHVGFNEELNFRVLQSYYQGLFEYVRAGTLPVETGEIGGRECFFISILGPGTPYPVLIAGHLSLCLVLDLSFKILSVPEAPAEFPVFLREHIDDDLAFVDTDGVGLALRHTNVEGSRKPSTSAK